MKKKIALVFVALVMVVVASVGGTLAWLTASTEEVSNVFTTADINVTLTETPNTDTDNNGTNDAWQAQMIPGYTYTKDPKVTVEANSVDCYLFVKFEETNNPSTYLTYTSTLTTANGWTQGDGTDIPANVWYREVSASTSDQSWELLKGIHETGCSEGENCTCEYGHGYVTVKDTLTKENMTTAASATLTYTAYASQLNKNATETFSAKEAWENVAPKA